MDLILCHTTADFDTLGAAVGLTKRYPGARIVLTGGSHPAVRDFLALHRDEYPLIERRSVIVDELRSLIIVDTQWRDRLGKAAEWLDLPNLHTVLYDHHGAVDGDIHPTEPHVEPVGAATTLIVEQLQAQNAALTSAEATVMALGIHVDTGSLTYDHSTVRDAAALTWLMGQGANLRAIAEYVEPGLPQDLQDILSTALAQLTVDEIQGLAIASVLLSVESYTPGLSSVVARLMASTESDVLLLAARYPGGDPVEERLTLIGRARGGTAANQLAAINLGAVFASWGGGGHAKAAAATLRTADPAGVFNQVVQQIKDCIPQPPTARDLMSSPVRTIRPDTTIAEAQRILLRYGHSGLSVVDEAGQLVGIISRRDLDIALHHGFSHAPVKGYMTPNLKTITPGTALPEIEGLMVTYDIGRLPVLDQEQLVGIVTRTDVLRQLHQAKATPDTPQENRPVCPWPERVRDLLRDRLSPLLWEVLMVAATEAQQRNWQIYLVGGAVRDLLLAGDDDVLLIDDIDLVVDGIAAEQGAGVELAQALQVRYPQSRLQVHGRFQTAALLWHNDPQLDSLWLDIATARTEFYPYPAANPEVEASSIRQDLYRRDFTINALAVRLTAPRTGELLDFFGGMADLQTQSIRVLHANSFIEDPTRIYRAVRFAVRLGFTLEPQTKGYIRHAIASGIYYRVQSEMERTPALQTRLKQELKYILQAPYWRTALRLLSDLGALSCLHSDLMLDATLWRQLTLLNRGLRRFDPAQQLEHWQLLLERLLLQLGSAEGSRVAERLQLSTDSIQRLRQFDHVRSQLQGDLAGCTRPSQIVALLQNHDLGTLALLLESDRPMRHLVWRYLTHWSRVKPVLDGNDLKALGYKPGKQFKPILEALLAATLDEEVRDRAAAETFLSTRFPKAIA